MDDERRRRFKAWFAARYGDKVDARARFMADSGRRGSPPLTKGRVAQLFDDDQPFGERAARSLALRLGLAESYFLEDQDVDPAPEATALGHLRTLRRIAPATFDRLASEIARIADGARAATRVSKTDGAGGKDAFRPGAVRLPPEGEPQPAIALTGSQKRRAGGKLKKVK